MITPWHRRKLAIRGAALTAFLAYLASFAVVHHRAWQRRQDWGIDCLMLTEVTDLQSWHAHRRLAVFFAPLYWLRSASTGQPGPCVNEPLFELSPDESHPHAPTGPNVNSPGQRPGNSAFRFPQALQGRHTPPRFRPFRAARSQWRPLIIPPGRIVPPKPDDCFCDDAACDSTEKRTNDAIRRRRLLAVVEESLHLVAEPDAGDTADHPSPLRSHLFDRRHANQLTSRPAALNHTLPSLLLPPLPAPETIPSFAPRDRAGSDLPTMPPGALIQ